LPQSATKGIGASIRIPKIKKLRRKSGAYKFQVRHLGNRRGTRHRNRRFATREHAPAHIMKMMDIEKANMGQCFLDNTTFADEAKFWLESPVRSFSRSHVINVAGILREILPDLGNCRRPKLIHFVFMFAFGLRARLISAPA